MGSRLKSQASGLSALSGEKANKRFKNNDNGSDAGGIENSKENNDDLMGQLISEEMSKIVN